MASRGGPAGSYPGTTIKGGLSVRGPRTHANPDGSYLPQSIDANGFFYEIVQAGITAQAGGGQASATPLTGQICQVTTVATAGDSVLLPASVPGNIITVTNFAAANSMNVFPAAAEQINSLGASAAFAVAAGKSATFTCAVAGQWHTMLSA